MRHKFQSQNTDSLYTFNNKINNFNLDKMIPLNQMNNIVRRFSSGWTR